MESKNDYKSKEELEYLIKEYTKSAENLILPIQQTNYMIEHKKKEAKELQEQLIKLHELIREKDNDIYYTKQTLKGLNDEFRVYNNLVNKNKLRLEIKQKSFGFDINLLRGKNGILEWRTEIIKYDMKIKKEKWENERKLCSAIYKIQKINLPRFTNQDLEKLILYINKYEEKDEKFSILFHMTKNDLTHILSNYFKENDIDKNLKKEFIKSKKYIKEEFFKFCIENLLPIILENCKKNNLVIDYNNL